MARAALPVTELGTTGVAPGTLVPGTVDGLMVLNDGRTMVEVVNTGGSSRTVTFVTPKQFSGLAVADLAVAIPAGATRLFSRFGVDVFNQPAGSTDQGRMYINFPSGNEAELSVRAYRG